LGFSGAERKGKLCWDLRGCDDFILNKGMAQKGLGASLLPSVGVQFTEDTRGKRDYKAVLRSYKKNPKQITGKAIGSFSSTR
jgi:hypothetical protein